MKLKIDLFQVLITDSFVQIRDVFQPASPASDKIAMSLRTASQIFV